MFYFTSDIHFSDQATIENDMRPFKTTKKFDSYIIKLWNKQATKKDVIYVIGDLVDCDGAGFYSWRKALLYVKKIKAKIVLVLGNNEERIIKNFFNNSFVEFKNYCISIGFKDVVKNCILTMRDKNFYLTHKPCVYKNDYITLFGHIHASGGIYKPCGLNVGCDLYHYRLLSENDIFHLLKKKKKYWDNSKYLNEKLNDKV